jgi:ketosteroid isomerase-like protein
MRTMSVFAAAAIAASVAGCAPGQPSGPTLEDDIAAIMAFNERYLGSINDEDIGTLASLTTEHHVMIAPNRPPIVGKAANDEMNGKAFEEFRFDETWNPTETVVSGDLAFQSGSYSSTATPRAGGDARTIKGTFLRIYQRQRNGEWRMTRDTFNTETTPATN